MRAVLVFNPHATTTDDGVRDAIAARLGSVCNLDLQPTKQRGHATHIVAGALDEGVDTVFVLGGDGTVNEVVQAMAGTEVPLGAIPGGGTNVFARALGLPNDALQATQALVDAIDAGAPRTISLGSAANRYFCFHAGFGFDAAVVRGVEQSPRLKRWLRQAAFVAVTLRTLVTDAPRATATISLRADDGTTLGPASVAIVGNTDPWTYLQALPLHVTPRATFETGLDVTLLGAMSTTRLGAVITRALRGRLVGADDVTLLHDLTGFELSSPVPLPLQLDGDYAGEHSSIRVQSVDAALSVWAPASRPARA